MYINRNKSSSLGKRKSLSEYESTRDASYRAKKIKYEFDCNRFSMKQINKFIKMTEEDPVIQEFLVYDQCHKYADKYLLAIVFVYFIRAKLSLLEYNRDNFFRALYLAHDIEEDDDIFQREVMLWGLDEMGASYERKFLKERDQLWVRMDYRALVNIQCCRQVMNSKPDSPLWQRERSLDHVVRYGSEWECPKCKMEENYSLFIDLESGDALETSNSSDSHRSSLFTQNTEE